MILLVFIDNLAYSLFVMGFVSLLLLYMMSSMYLAYRKGKRDFIDYIRGATVPLAVIGIYIIISGIYGQLTWPLPGSYNILFYDPFISLGIAIVSFAAATRYRVRLEYIGFLSLLFGVMVIVYGITAYGIKMTTAPFAMLVLYILYGIVGILAYPASMIVDRLPGLKRGMWYGWNMVFVIFWIFLLVAVSSLIQGMVVLFFVRERGTFRKSKMGSGRIQMISFDRFLLVFSVGTFLVTLVSSQFSVTLPLYAGVRAAVPTDLIGYIYAVNGLVVVLGQYPMTWVTRRLNVVTVMIMGSLFYSLGYFLVALSTNLYGLMIDMVFITVGENLTTPGMNTVVSRIAPAGKTGRYMGFLSMANSGGRAVGPSIGAFLMFFFAYRGLEVWGALASLGIVSISILSIFYFAVYRSYSSYGTDAV